MCRIVAPALSFPVSRFFPNVFLIAVMHIGYLDCCMRPLFMFPSSTPDTIDDFERQTLIF